MSTGSAFTPLIPGIRVLEPLLTVIHDWGAALGTTLIPEAQEMEGFGLARGGIDRGILVYRMGESAITDKDLVGSSNYHVQLHVSPSAAAPATLLGMAQDSQVLLEYGFDQTAAATGTAWKTIGELTDTPPEAMLLVQNPSIIAAATSTTLPRPVVRFWYKWVEMERALFNALVRR